MNDHHLSLYKSHPNNKIISLLLVSSTILLLLGLYLPIITLNELVVFKSTFSVITGILALFHENHVILGIVILLFSVLFPIAKLISLFYVWFFNISENTRNQIITWMGKLGKWSMLDVFIVALTIIIAKLSGFADAKAHIGIYFFAVSVILTMIVSALIEKLTGQ